MILHIPEDAIHNADRIGDHITVELIDNHPFHGDMLVAWTDEAGQWRTRKGGHASLFYYDKHTYVVVEINEDAGPYTTIEGLHWLKAQQS